MKTLKPFGNVPIKIAMIAWTPIRSSIGNPGHIAIIPHPTPDGDWFRRLGLTDSAGACFVDWKPWPTHKQLLQLYIEAWHIVCRDGLDPQDIHNALSVIPEYRDSLSEESFFRNINQI